MHEVVFTVCRSAALRDKGPAGLLSGITHWMPLHGCSTVLIDCWRFFSNIALISHLIDKPYFPLDALAWVLKCSDCLLVFL
jgi:hypothetical protein